jgi:ABC-type multidrug transport system fused ATPase/permease subunit
VIEALERLMKGRTVITIAHRLSTIKDADKIIVLKDGVVAEEGTNDELIALKGVYAELHRIQYEVPTAKAS